MPNDPDESRAVALVDVDGDTDLDIVVGNTISPSGAVNRLLLNDGSGMFADAPSGSFPQLLRRTFATHDAGFTLFEIGGTASLGLAIMAETGNPGTLAGEVSGDANVSDTVVLPFPNRVPPVMLPGESNSAEITAEGDAKYFTAVGMLAATNDAFYAVRGVALPKTGSITVYADAYDAGSETNTELLGDIPGGGNDGFNDPIDDGEGYIHIHAGIHGLGDQLPEVFDWRNPVLEITITRLSDHD